METSYPLSVRTYIEGQPIDEQTYRRNVDRNLVVPAAWVTRLIQCGLTSMSAVDAAPDAQLAHALGVGVDVVPEVRASVATLRDARAKAEAERAMALERDRQRAEIARAEARAQAEERRQRLAETLRLQAAAEFEAARVRAEAARVKAEQEAEAARARAEAVAQMRAEYVAKCEAAAAAERARLANALALRDTKPSVFDYHYRWPPGPSQFDNIGLSPRLHAIVRAGGWVSLAAIRDTNDADLVHRTDNLGVVGLREIRALIGYNEIDMLGRRFGWSVRTLNGLRNNAVKTLAQLGAISDQELLRTPNFGKKSLREVRDTVATLRRPPPPEPVEDIEAAIAAELGDYARPWQPRDGDRLDLLELSVRAGNGLRHGGGLTTITEADQLTDQELLRLPNFGRKSLAEFNEVVRPAAAALRRYRTRTRLWPERARP